MKKIPFLSNPDIERASIKLLNEYRNARGKALSPPIDIEDILENYLKLSLDFDDLHERLDVPRLGHEPEVLGALYVETQEVFIDQSLDPDENPAGEGRFRFSVGHEIGHWRLHRTLIQKDRTTTSEEIAASVICRTRAGKEPIERQADHFSSCLLMPRQMIYHEWCKVIDGNELEQAKHELVPLDKTPPPLTYSKRIVEFVYERWAGDFDDFLDTVATSFAAQFKVSRQAMRIRLEKLNLLQRGVRAA